MIIQGNAENIPLPDNSVDLLVTDPPFGLSDGKRRAKGKKATGGFMGKKWDADVPSVEAFRECLRVLKPGAFAFWMCAPRLDCQAAMAERLVEAGFRIDFSPLYHTYACVSEDTEVLTEHGWRNWSEITRLEKIAVFHPGINAYSWEQPYAWNVQKTEDAYRIWGEHTDQIVTGNHRVAVVERGGVCFEYAETLAQEGRIEKTPWIPFDHGMIPYWRVATAAIEPVNYQGMVYCPSVSTGAFVARRKGMIFITGNSGFPKAASVGKLIDRRLGAKREVVGSNPNHRPVSGVEYEGVCQGRITVSPDITAPATPEAKRFEGAYAGLQMKPALEIVICAMAPLSEKSYTDQALANGKGCTWLDACRIPTGASDVQKMERCNTPGAGRFKYSSWSGGYAGKDAPLDVTQGRFPANLVVSTQPVDPLGAVETASPNTYTRRADGFSSGVYGNSIGEKAGSRSLNFGDSGSYSRMFDLDRWWEHLNGDPVEELPPEVQQTLPFMIVPKASKAEKNIGIRNRKKSTVDDGRKKSIDNPFQRGETLRKNTHPTVKPIKLMSYLITLGSREGDLVLDPFMGSGTTGLAAKRLRREFVGIDLNREYVEISRARMSGDQPLMDLMEE
jgi:DNA modification methylase